MFYYRYSSFDKNPVPGNNFYRIKAVENSGKANYSQVMNVKLSSIKGNIIVFPNPFEGNTISLQFTNQPKGNYEVSLMNTLGQQFLHTVIQHPGGSTTLAMTLPSYTTKGMYKLQVRDGDYNTALKLIKK